MRILGIAHARSEKPERPARREHGQPRQSSELLRHAFDRGTVEEIIVHIAIVGLVRAIGAGIPVALSPKVECRRGKVVVQDAVRDARFGNEGDVERNVLVERIGGLGVVAHGVVRLHTEPCTRFVKCPRGLAQVRSSARRNGAPRSGRPTARPCHMHTGASPRRRRSCGPIPRPPRSARRSPVQHAPRGLRCAVARTDPVTLISASGKVKGERSSRHRPSRGTSPSRPAIIHVLSSRERPSGRNRTRMMPESRAVTVSRSPPAAAKARLLSRVSS